MDQNTVMDKSIQLDELDSLKNIFYSEEFQVLENPDQTGEIQAIFWAFFTLPDNYTIKYMESLDSIEPSYLKVKHLPPIQLKLTLPKDYPSKNPPEFIMSCQWLQKSKISLLCKKLDEIWLNCESVEIIYSWCDFLKNDSLRFLGYENELDITDLCLVHLTFIQRLQREEERKRKWRQRYESKFNGNMRQLRKTNASPNGTVGGSPEKTNIGPNSSVSLKGARYNHNRSQQRHPYNNITNYKSTNKNSGPKKGRIRFDERVVLNLSLKTSPVKILENYNSEREKVEFLKKCYTCNICYSDKLGKDCMQFKDCKHVFCINCMRSYFTVKIKDGTVQSIKCPEEKCSTEALPPQVKEVVSEELFAKYDSVLLSSALDTLSDIVYCPRQICQYPVSCEPEEKMAICPNCQFVFCVVCRMVYHGVEPCQSKTEVRKLVEQYENSSAEVRQQMESRYGKKRLESLVNNSKTEDWLKENSKTCPKCEAAIEKNQGCNKMVCWNCNVSFCWLCCDILDSNDPYSHFTDPHSSCADKLFYLMYNAEDDEDYWDWDWVDDSEEGSSDLDFDVEDEY